MAIVLDGRKLMANVTVDIEVRRLKAVTLRVRVAFWALKAGLWLAELVAPCSFEVIVGKEEFK